MFANSKILQRRGWSKTMEDHIATSQRMISKVARLN